MSYSGELRMPKCYGASLRRHVDVRVRRRDKWGRPTNAMEVWQRICANRGEDGSVNLVRVLEVGYTRTIACYRWLC